ncbi:hypothetical protein R4Z10_09335 [Niallia sp. XMNu-256]|uniref:hypothetical protein n=1 Tax=Niallia sp. XMNu-256 TaxID=3082444 RepID=UPI0030CC4C79
MKKYVLFILLTITLIVSACSNTQETASKTSAEKETENPVQQEPSTQNKTEGTNSQEDQEVTASPKDLFDIQLNSKLNTVNLIKPGEKPIVLSDRDPSEPVKSPNGKKAAYLSPFGWEELSDLFIVDLQDGSQHVLVSTDYENKPKDVIWEDDDHVLVIIGFPHGTIIE